MTFQELYNLINNTVAKGYEAVASETTFNGEMTILSLFILIIVVMVINRPRRY